MFSHSPRIGRPAADDVGILRDLGYCFTFGQCHYNSLLPEANSLQSPPAASADVDNSGHRRMTSRACSSLSVLLGAVHSQSLILVQWQRKSSASKIKSDGRQNIYLPRAQISGLALLWYLGY